jgi:hypothetical protein
MAVPYAIRAEMSRRAETRPTYDDGMLRLAAFMGVVVLVALGVAGCSRADASRQPRVGDACKKGGCAGPPHLACFDDLCACEAPFVACADGCFDLTSDRDHCGACETSCGSDTCRAGQCGAAPVPTRTSAGKSADVTPSVCGSEYESHPARSLTNGILYAVTADGRNPQVVSWAADPTKWTVAGRVPHDPEQVPNGDEWSTSGPFAGREFFSMRTPLAAGAPPGPMGEPDFIVPDPRSIQEGKLGDKLEPVLPTGLEDDGMSIAYDPGGSSLWIGATGGHTGPHGPSLVVFPVCKGMPTRKECERDAALQGRGYVDLTKGDSGRSWASHTTVVVNPCTHHALVAFLENERGGKDLKRDFEDRHGYVVVKAIDHKGDIVARWEQKIGYLHPDTGCADAGSASFDCTTANLHTLCPAPTATNHSCCPSAGKNECQAKGEPSYVSRAFARVQLDVRAEARWGGPPRCTLYLGWDEVVGYPKARRRATLGAIDVSDESTGANGVGKVTVLTSVDPARGESIDAVPVASRFADVFGLFYVQRDPSGATEVVRARVTRDPKFGTYTDLALTPPLRDTWMGDSMSHVLGGLPGYRLFATWPQQVRKKTEKGERTCGTIEGAVIDVAPVERVTHLAEIVEIEESFVPDPTIYESVLVDTVIEEGAEN